MQKKQKFEIEVNLILTRSACLSYRWCVAVEGQTTQSQFEMEFKL